MDKILEEALRKERKRQEDNIEITRKYFNK